MSRFIDKLKRTSQAVPQPMGFGRGQSVSPKPKILLVASLAQAGVSNLASLVAGADAGLISISELKIDTKTLHGCSEAVPDIPWGGWLRGSKRRESQKAKGLDCDFVIFPSDTPLGIFERNEAGKKGSEASKKDTEVGRILEVGPSLSDGLLRTIDELPVDGVLIAGEGEGSSSLTWQRLMRFQHFADLMVKPLLVPVSSKVTASELQMLWEAGVDGIIVGVGVSQPSGELRKLRQTIDKLTFPSQKRRGKVKALLPQISVESGVEEIEEEPPDDL